MGCRSPLISAFPQITASPSSPALLETASSLTSLIRSVFISLPDAFVAAPLWTAAASQLDNLLLSSTNLESALRATLLADLSDLRARAEAASEATQDEDSAQQDELEKIEILDAIACPVSLAATHRALFHKRKRRRPLRDELGLLFTWATCGDRAGAHRPYAVAALLKLELAHAAASTQPKTDIEAAFIGWLDQGPPPSHDDVVDLLSEMIRVGVASYSLYLQRMIARGETEPRPGQSPSPHLHLLNSVGVYEFRGNALVKRKAALRTRTAPLVNHAALVERAEDELVRVMPKLVDRFTLDLGLERDCKPLLDTLKELVREGAHLVLTRELIPQAVVRLIKDDGAGESSVGLEDHALLSECFLVVRDYWGMLQYLLLLLRSQPPRALVVHVLDVVESELDTWTGMAELPTLAGALLAAHTSLSSAGINERRLVNLLHLLGSAGHLDSPAFAQLQADQTRLSASLSTSTGVARQTLPNTGLAELGALSFNQSPAAISQLAVTVWYRYQSFENWAVVVFDAAVQLLAHVPMATVLAFLKEVAERLPVQLEKEVGRWVEGMKPKDVAGVFGGPLGPTLAGFLGELVNDGALSAAGAVRLVVVPAWRAVIVEASAGSAVDLAAGANAVVEPMQLKALETIASVFGTLVGHDCPGAGALSPASPAGLLARQRSDSRRTSLFTHSSLHDVGHCIAFLVIQQELVLATGLTEDAAKATALLAHISALPAFQMTVARDPQALASAILESPSINSLPVAALYRPRLLAGLLLTLKDGTKPTVASLVSSEDWDLFLSGLTMWRLSISKVEVRAALQRLELDQSLSEEDKGEALVTLSAHFLDRVCSGEGHTYLGEQVVRCYHGRASDTLVSVAFARLARALEGIVLETSPDERVSCLTDLRCTARLLDTLLDGSTAVAKPEPLQRLLGALKACLTRVHEEVAAQEAGRGSEDLRQKDTILHVTHLASIALRCAPSSPTAEAASLLRDCVVPCAKLAVLLSHDPLRESSLPLLLLDTCAHLLFGLGGTDAAAATPLWADLDDGVRLLPESIRSRLTRLLGHTPSATSASHAWDLVTSAPDPPILGPAAKRLNAGPIDLALFDAAVVAVVPAVSALTADARSTTSEGSHASGAPGTFANSNTLSADHARERGRQTNFDWETPAGKGTGMSVAARDHRRTLTARASPSKWDPQGREKKLALAKQQQAAAQAAGRAQAGSQEAAKGQKAASGQEAGAKAAGAGAGKKRKADVPEVLTLESDDDDVPLASQPKGRASAAAPPPSKRGKAATAGKTTVGRGGQGRKKPGKG